MIQRKQTLWLLLSLLLLIVTSLSPLGKIFSGGKELATVYSLWLTTADGIHDFVSWPLLAFLVLAEVVVCVSIFLFKRRKLQARMCLWALLVVVAWYVFLAVLPSRSGGEFVVGWQAALPMAAAAGLIMARKGIIADEKLVRSLDRIR